ncbi:hypothetical protein HP550_03570 [Cellulomonas humilata]|uniref:Uncharacterized protein n=1 Tax=Cellulomonas humilata TaxID=144055 RepID=A0A7Y6DWT8_9CELL|nr:hypothetical protein [Cellulomonas humilata]NUU16327.1 hypothetical protein [Cellulomonas humilata]
MPPAEQPVRSRLVRVLSVLAVLATVPLWAPPDHVTTADGVFMVAMAVPEGVATVRVVSLALVVVLALATLVVSRKAGAVASRRLAVLFVVPAVSLSWVGWRTEGGGSYTVALVGALGQDPPHAFASPWMPVAVAQAVLVVLLWTLAILGMLARRRTRSAEPTTSGVAPL